MTKEKSQRQLQAGEQIKRIIAEFLMREGMSTINGGYITVLQADISPDLKNCKIFVDIFGADDVKKKTILKSLNSAAPNIRHHLGKKLVLRAMPQIEFRLDETSQNAIDIAKLIDDEGERF